MRTVLIIDRDDLYLPRGWISGVLPEGVEPTEYEKNGGIWAIRQIDENDPALETRNTGRFPLRHAAMLSDQLKPVTAEEHLRMLRPDLARTFPGPDSLDRSHSTIWDYGTGRTYSTTQAAFDALYAQVGTAVFNETHYIRGFGGTFQQNPSTGCVLQLYSVNPSNKYRLVVDAESGETINFDGLSEIDGLGIWGSLGDATDVVDFVTVDSIRFTRCIAGIIPHYNPSATGTPPRAQNWIVRRIESYGPMDVAVLLGPLQSPRILDSKISRNKSGNAGVLDVDPNGSGSYEYRPAGCVKILGCLIVPENGYGIEIVDCAGSYLIANNTIVHKGADASYAGLLIDADDYVDLIMNNNVIALTNPVSGQACINIDGASPGLLNLYSDHNCFYSNGGKIAVCGANQYTLSEWQAETREDTNSMDGDPEFADPEEEDFSLGRTSPCLGAGACLDAFGLEGNPRAASIDAGCYQKTSTQVPGVITRRAPEIVRRT